MTGLSQDIRYAFRGMRKRPGFTIVAVLTLALGIGGTTAIFSVVHAVLLRPLPYDSPERLVRIWESNPDWSERNIVSSGNFMDWRDQATVFEGLAAYGGSFGLGLTGDGRPSRVTAVTASPGLFHLLGVPAEHGRVFARGDADAGGSAVLMSHGLWQRRYGGDPGIVGRTVTLNERPATVVGVMPAEFDFPSPAIDFWLPHRFDAEDRQARRSHRWRVLGRLEPGVSVERAQAEMDAVADRIRERHPEFMAGWSVRVLPFRADLVREARPLLLILMGMVGVVLLIACVNVANLLLARATTREREVAVRTALGAGRFRLVRQFLTESGAVAVLGGALGLLAAAWVLGLVVGLGPDDIPLLEDTRLDATVFGFAAGVTVLSTLLFGLVPALRSSGTDLGSAMRTRSGATGAPRHSRLRGGLLVGEVALALVLLVGAGLLLRSFAEVQSVDHGFDADRLLAVSLDLPGSRYPGTPQQLAFYDRLVERLEALPGVASAAGTPEPPVVGFNNTFSFIIEGRVRPGPDGREDPVEVRAVTPGYVRTVGVPLLAGRALRERDGAEAPRVAVVNEALARRHWNGADAVGERITFDDEGGGPWVEIVGVVGDTRHYGLERPAEPAMYIPHAQRRWGWMSWMTLMVRAETDPAAQIGAARNAVWEIDDGLPIDRIAPVTDLYADSNARRRFATVLIGLFAALALVLGVVGIYGVVSYGVVQRRRELGIRVALGAERGTITAAVVRRGLRPTLAGILVGLAAALALTRLMAGLLFGVEPTDPITFVAVAGVLVAAACAASYLPARRAARVDPMTVLRTE